MSAPLLLGIDDGTTAVKVSLFDPELRPLAETQRRVATTHPGPGLVEQDPLEVLEAVQDAVGEILAAAPEQAPIVAGLAHQGESVLAWDAIEGTPLTPVVVWQDKRQERLLAELAESDVAVSGMPLDPYFSAGKLAWLLRHDPSVQRAAARGRLRMGTVDSFLTDRLGGRFATDLSTASRTQLLALGGADWDPGLLDVFGLRREWLPALGQSAGALGELSSGRWPRRLPLRAQLVDQQAALAGAGCVSPGLAKATYGTGVFVLARTAAPERAQGVLPTVAWSLPAQDGTGEVAHALDGGVFTAGALLEWLAGDLGLASDVPALTALAAQVPDSAGVKVLPALAGLGSPHWRPAARGLVAGLHGGVRAGHVARAALEAIAQRVADIVEAMSGAVALDGLRVDGGLTNDPTLLQIQADALGLPLTAARADTTVLGAAMLAGVGAGVFRSLDEVARLLPAGRAVAPRLSERERLQRREAWRAFVARAAALAELS